MAIYTTATNATGRVQRFSWHYKRLPRILHLNKYELNQEVMFEDQEEYALFLKLFASKIDEGTLLFGDKKEVEAQKANEKLEEKEKKKKEKLNEEANAKFQEQTKQQLGSENVKVEISQEKGRGRGSK